MDYIISRKNSNMIDGCNNNTLYKQIFHYIPYRADSAGNNNNRKRPSIPWKYYCCCSPCRCYTLPPQYVCFNCQVQLVIAWIFSSFHVQCNNYVYLESCAPSMLLKEVWFAGVFAVAACSPRPPPSERCRHFSLLPLQDSCCSCQCSCKWRWIFFCLISLLATTFYPCSVCNFFLLAQHMPMTWT